MPKDEALYRECIVADLIVGNPDGSTLLLWDYQKSRDLLERYGKTYYVIKDKIGGGSYLEVPFVKYVPFEIKKAVGE